MTQRNRCFQHQFVVRIYVYTCAILFFSPVLASLIISIFQLAALVYIYSHIHLDEAQRAHCPFQSPQRDWAGGRRSVARYRINFLGRGCWDFALRSRKYIYSRRRCKFVENPQHTGIREKYSIVWYIYTLLRFIYTTTDRARIRIGKGVSERGMKSSHDEEN